MVRVDTLTRAKELEEIYDRNTELDLAFVNGHHSLSHVKRIVQKLRQGELNGIVCVNMFGEGFNLPTSRSQRFTARTNHLRLHCSSSAASPEQGRLISAAPRFSLSRRAAPPRSANYTTPALSGATSCRTWPGRVSRPKCTCAKCLRASRLMRHPR
jgi:hypothetical protein